MKRLASIVLIALALLAGLPAANAQPGDRPAAISSGYDLSWSSIDGGGAMFSSGGAFSLGGTIGQPDAATSSGGGYALAGGFWPGAAIDHTVYLPLALRN